MRNIIHRTVPVCTRCWQIEQIFSINFPFGGHSCILGHIVPRSSCNLHLTPLLDEDLSQK